MEAAWTLGSVAIAKHPFFSGLHYCAGHLRAALAAGVDVVCECSGDKGGDEKDERYDYQQEKHKPRLAANSAHCRIMGKSDCYSFLSLMIFKVLATILLVDV